MLNSAIDEFEDLIGKTDGPDRLDNILSLCAALFDRSEAAAEGDAVAEQALSRVVKLVRRWLPTYSSDVNSLGTARLNLFLALALQSLAERSDDQADLAASEEAYHLAISGLTTNKDPDGRLMDAKSGLAAVLQVRGEKDRDADKLRKAVALHRE